MRSSITRDGQEINLTWQEMLDIYKTVAFDYCQEDLCEMLEDMYIDPDMVSDETWDNILENYLSNREDNVDGWREDAMDAIESSQELLLRDFKRLFHAGDSEDED